MAVRRELNLVGHLMTSVSRGGSPADAACARRSHHEVQWTESADQHDRITCSDGNIAGGRRSVPTFDTIRLESERRRLSLGPKVTKSLGMSMIFRGQGSS